MKRKKSVEDYLKAIYLLERKSGIARGADIAEQLGVSRPTVSVSLKALEQEGYLYRDTGHAIHLTSKGLKIARGTYERYQTLRRLLMRLGVDDKTASDDSCEMEHALSPKSYRALKSLLKEPNLPDAPGSKTKRGNFR